MHDIKYILLVFLLLIKGMVGYGLSYTSIASGSFTDVAAWSLPWVGAPLPPGSSQSVVISAGTTITGSTSSSYSLNVQGYLTINGDYSNSSGGLTIEDGGIMVVTGNMATSSSLVINGLGKLMVLGNLTQTGGSISINGTGILVVGQSFTEGWQTANLYNSATLLVIQNYNVNGNLHENGTGTTIAVLGTVIGGGCSGCTNSIATTDPAWDFWNCGMPNVWIGASSDSWTNTANWSSHILPASGGSIELSVSASNDLVLDADRTISSLKNLSSKRMLIPPGKCLTVNNTITTSNDPNQIYIQASSSGAGGSLIFHNAVGSPVQATVEMYSLASWNLANPAGSKYKWQFFGIPIRSLATASPTFDGAYVREMRENSSPAHWYQLTNTSGLTSFTGYEISQSVGKTYIFQGQLENSNYSVTQSYTSGASYSGQNLIANSYTAAIDISKIVFGSQMLATVYLYNTGSRGDWLAVGENPSADSTTIYAGQFTAVPFALAGSGTLPGQIPSMQAFLVRAKMLSGNATVSIPYSTATTVVKNTTMQRASAVKENDESDKMWTCIEVKGTRFSDKMWIFTDSGCSHFYDNGWDGEKLFGSSVTPQIYAMEPEGDYQVNSVNDMNNTDLGFYAGLDSIYTITFTNHNFNLKYAGMYLQDLVKNTITYIPQDGGSYSFKAVASDVPVKRFKILTRLNLPSSLDNPTNDKKQLFIFSSQQNVFVHNRTNEKGNLMLYNISGKILKQLTFEANTLTTIPANLAPGTYVAHGKTATEDLTEKIIIE